MKRVGIVILLLFACQQQREAPPAGKQTIRVTTTNIPSNERGKKEKDLIRPSMRFLESAKLGTKLGADGAVADEMPLVEPGQPVYLTLNLRESPAGLQTHAVWLDPNGKELRKELHEMKGAKSVTFAMTQNLAPGRYRVEGYWGGNLAADKTFEVVAVEKNEKKKK